MRENGDAVATTLICDGYREYLLLFKAVKETSNDKASQLLSFVDVQWKPRSLLRWLLN
jgi:hypothetical protein